MTDELQDIIKSLPPEQQLRMRERFQEDLERSGAKYAEAANKFQAGLEGVTNVMLNLVLNFGRASTLLLVIGAINTLCLIMMVISTIQVTAVKSQMDDLLLKQEASAKRLEKTTTESNEEVVKKVEETKAKVDNVVETAPKVKVDARTGKAKLVVPAPSATPSKKSYEFGLE